jgi:hypothetical protein
MGQAKRELERQSDLNMQAQSVAKEAGAIKECDLGHLEIMIDQGDDEANKRAYAIGTNRWKEGLVDGTREEFMDAIKDAIESASYDCPRCEKLMADD